jgi:hypothetical protein
VFDFDAASGDAATGQLKVAMQHNSSMGGAGDRLHPKRAMANAIDLATIAQMMFSVQDRCARKAGRNGARGRRSRSYRRCRDLPPSSLASSAAMRSVKDCGGSLDSFLSWLCSTLSRSLSQLLTSGPPLSP